MPHDTIKKLPPPFQFLLIAILSFLLACPAFSQGLKFSGMEKQIDERTSFRVFGRAKPEMRDSLVISFDFALYNISEIGYILRIKDNKEKRVFNLFYDGQGDTFQFRLNEEGKFSLIKAEIKKTSMNYRIWYKTSLKFDFQKDSIILNINGQRFSSGYTVFSQKSYRPEIFFGKSDYIIDVPSFAIKNLEIGDRKKWFFPLDEQEGNIATDASMRIDGIVNNPEWLINEAMAWKLIGSFSSDRVAAAGYDVSTKDIYYYNRDTLYTYNVVNNSTKVEIFGNRCPVQMKLGLSFTDTLNKRLYAYEVYNDTDPEHYASMAFYDKSSGSWHSLSNDYISMQLHHHASFLDLNNSKYYIFGGFGNMRYNGKFYNFDLVTNKWNEGPMLHGDIIYPRYFTSIGADKGNLYVFGGMGNESGEQVVGRRYFYDLHRVNLETGRSELLWKAEWNEADAVPLRNLVVKGDSFYTLCYPESISNSSLQLYKFSIKDGSYTKVGNSIPIHSDKITTNANLYYDEQLEKMFVTVQEFEDDDIRSHLKIYSIIFPPLTESEMRYGNSGIFERVIIVSFGFFILIISILILLNVLNRRKVGKEIAVAAEDSRNDIQENIQIQEKKKPIIIKQTRPNSLYLFGDLAIKDKENNNLAISFSTQLREALILIFINSGNGGISSMKFTSLLWPDKSKEKAKNSRGVTINHIRKLLKNIDMELVYEDGHFKFVTGNDFYCDYSDFLNITKGDIDKNIGNILDIISRGRFIKFLEDPMFDSYKETIDNNVENILGIAVEKEYENKEYQTVISICESLFEIDPLDEKALTFMIRAQKKLKMNEEAMLSYSLFVNEYKKVYESDYKIPFAEI